MRTSLGSASGFSGVCEKKRTIRNVVGPTISSVVTICSRTPKTAEEMAAVDGVGGVIASTVRNWFDQPVNQVFVERLRSAGLNFGDPEAARQAAEARAAVPQTLDGRTVVVTGAVPGYNREEAEAAIVLRGGKSPGSVSKKTFALVVGEGAGASKLSKAESFGTPIVPAERFEDFLTDPEGVVAEVTAP